MKDQAKLVSTEEHDYLILAPKYTPSKVWRLRIRSDAQIAAMDIHRKRWDHFGHIGRLHHSKSAYACIMSSPSATLRAKQLADHIAGLHRQLMEEMKNRVGC